VLVVLMTRRMRHRPATLRQPDAGGRDEAEVTPETPETGVNRGDSATRAAKP
jgi:hypothetical protein